MKTLKGERVKCLDTNFLIDVLQGRPDAKKVYESFVGEKIIVPSIAAFELYSGLVYSSNPTKELAGIETELSLLTMASFTKNEALTGGQIVYQMKKKGTPISAMDAMIAATAITNNCGLVTRDKNFKNIHGLQVVNY